MTNQKKDITLEERVKLSMITGNVAWITLFPQFLSSAESVLDLMGSHIALVDSSDGLNNL